jgi:acyl dehydratase
MSELRGLEGAAIGLTEYVEISQERISRFAEVTEDYQWIHLDADRAARESPYGGAIAHGFLTLSLAGHFTKQLLEVTDARFRVNYGLGRVRFPSAVRAGSRVRGEVAVGSVKEVSGGIQVEFFVTVECENAAKPACVAEFLVRYYNSMPDPES